MPAFVLLSGMLTRGIKIADKEVGSLVRTLLVPYVIFQAIYMAYYDYRGYPVDWNIDRFLSPMYLLWFLPALLIWRWMAPILLRIPFVIPISILISLGAGLTGSLDNTLALNRVFAYLPFFVIGLVIGRGRLPKSRGLGIKTAAALVLVAAMPFAMVFHEKLGINWLYWNLTYEKLEVSTMSGIGIRLGMIVLALIMTAAVCVLVPTGRNIFTRCGENSMYVYVLHGFITLTFGLSTIDSLVREPWQFVVVVVLAIVICLLLASNSVKTIFRFLVSPQYVPVSLKDQDRAVN